MAASSFPQRPTSPVREMEPDFDVLEQVPVQEERKLPTETLVIEQRLFQEEGGVSTCFALKVHNMDGYTFYIKGEKLPYAMEAGDPVYIVKRRHNDIPASAKEGLMTAVGLEINGLVFEKSNELVVVTRKEYDYEEMVVVRTMPRETSPHYLVYPIIFYADYLETSPEDIKDSVKRASIAINKNSSEQCFEGIDETLETLHKYFSTIKDYSDLAKRFLRECKTAISDLSRVIKQWEDQPESKEQEEKLRILRNNLYEKRKAEMRLIPFSRLVVDRKHSLEQAIDETTRLSQELQKI